MNRILSVLIIIIIFVSCKIPVEKTVKKQNIYNEYTFFAKGHDKRIDIRWEPGPEQDDPSFDGYKIYYATESDPEDFQHRNTFDTNGVRKINIYSDWIDSNGVKHYYKVRVKTTDNEYDLYPLIASATTKAESDEEFLTGVQEATFRYFYDGGHPVSGLTRERYPWDNACTIGGTGMGLMAMPIGVERGFASRQDVAEHVLKMLRFLDDNADRFHGAWPHWLDGETGEAIFFMSSIRSDLVETAFLMEGILTVRQYFDGSNAVETEIRQIADSLWSEEGNCVEWEWFLNGSPNTLTWHWSPTEGFANSRPVVGFDETMMTYLLAIACPNEDHDIPVTAFKDGYCRGGGSPYTINTEYYGYIQYLANGGNTSAKGMPLFFTHYSFLGFDPRGKNDGNLQHGITYFNAFKYISLIDRAYCITDGGFAFPLWGLTASINPWGYGVQTPDSNNGTITPTAFIGAIPYVGEDSIETMRYVYDTYTWQIWGEFGFKDSFNPGQNWFPGDEYIGLGYNSEYYLAIDQGPIVIMIENYRTGLLWKLFMSHPDIQRLLDILRGAGWTITEQVYE